MSKSDPSKLTLNDPSIYDFLERDLPKGYKADLYINPDPLKKGVTFLNLRSPTFNPAVYDATSDGWKFHLSVDPRDLPKAWDVVTPILMKHNVGEAKATVTDAALRFHDPAYPQAGKQITIYNSGDTSWEKLTRDLEIELRATSIRPSARVDGDRPIPGSSYASYRNEKASEKLQKIRANADVEKWGTYVPADEIRDKLIPGKAVLPQNAHNPSGFVDPIEHLDFSKDLLVLAAGKPSVPDYFHLPKLETQPHISPPVPQPRTGKNTNYGALDHKLHVDGHAEGSPQHAPKPGEPPTAFIGPELPPITLASELPQVAPDALRAVAPPLPAKGEVPTRLIGPELPPVAGPAISATSASEAAANGANAERTATNLTREGVSGAAVVETTFAVAPIIVSSVIEGGSAMADGKSPAEIAKATGHGALNGAFGIDDARVAFDSKQRPVDRIIGGTQSWLALRTTELAVMAPFTEGATGLAAAATGAASIGLGIVQDVAHWTGLGNRKGTIEQTSDMVKSYVAAEKAHSAMQDALAPLSAVASYLEDTPDLLPKVSRETGNAIISFTDTRMMTTSGAIAHGAVFAKQLAAELQTAGPGGDAVRNALGPFFEKAGSTPARYADALRGYGAEIDTAGAKIKAATPGEITPTTQDAANRLLRVLDKNPDVPLPKTFNFGEAGALPPSVRPNRGALRQELAVVAPTASSSQPRKDAGQDVEVPS